jgi:hypothetical protein
MVFSSTPRFHLPLAILIDFGQYIVQYAYIIQNQQCEIKASKGGSLLVII